MRRILALLAAFALAAIVVAPAASAADADAACDGEEIDCPPPTVGLAAEASVQTALGETVVDEECKKALKNPDHHVLYHCTH